MDECIFCKIVKGEIPSGKVKETDKILVIKDINPQAETHLLIIPKEHVRDITGLSDTAWLEIKKIGLELIKERGLNAFRIETNAGGAALVPHIHVHLLAEVEVDRKL